MKASPTPGGKRLRALREYHGKTQLDIELDGSLGIGYLQRLELGRVKQPERDTLERILTALNAHYTERREVLELFGYIMDAPIPMQAEIDWAITVSKDEINSAVFPMYLLDCAHRLLYWNPLVPKLFRVTHPTAKKEASRYVSMLKLVFDPAYGMMPRIQNADEFFPAQIRALRYEMQRFHDEAWHDALIEDMLRCEAFKRYWQTQTTIHIPARPLTPMQLQVDNILLSFRLISESYVQDQRFRVIFLLPVDAQTTQQCIDWHTNDVTALRDELGDLQ